MMDFILSVLQTLTLPVLILSFLIAAYSLMQLRKTKYRLRDKETVLNKKREKLRLLLDHTEDGVLIIQNLTFKYANKRVYEIMGLDNKQEISKNMADYIHPDDLQIALAGYEKTMLSGGGETNFKVRLIKPDREMLWVHIRSIPVVWDDEPANLAFMRDITSHKIMEQDLQQAQRMEAIGVLSGGIAHDFNNILTTIIGNAEIALMDIKGETPGKKEFEQIRDSGHRARDLVRQILTISREYTSEVQPLYLSPIIKEALKLLRSTLPRNIKIVEKIDRQVGLVKADSVRMYQVFMNLCTNAKHAMEKEETAQLEVELKNVVIPSSMGTAPDNMMPGNYVKLSVTDTGTGIDPGIADKIFDPHFTTKDKPKGTGLGLTTSLYIIKQFGGYITFDSDPGKGSCFSVFLPVHETEKSKEKTVNDTAPVQGKGKILFVDDETEITVMAQKMLTHLGFSVMTAGSGKQALDAFAREPLFFDLLITDLAMPEMTGIKLAKEVMRIRPGFPVIMCTGHSDTFDEEAARKAGIMEYVKKPYNLKELGALAAKYIKQDPGCLSLTHSSKSIIS
ncbi:MAG: response regulator [Desulfobacula sp.]|jgi:PAS domain S-box-containing protein